MQTWEKLCVSVSVRGGHLEAGITKQMVRSEEIMKKIPKPSSVAT